MTGGQVLLLGVDEDCASTLSEYAVERVADPGALGTALADRPHCVVAGEPPDGPVADVVDTVEETDPLLPVVLVGAAAPPDAAPTALSAGAAAYVQWPGEEAAEDLRSAVSGAVERYRRRRDRARLCRDAPDEGCVVRDGEIALASDGFADLLGGSGVEGESLRELVSEGDRARLREAIETADPGRTSTIEFAPAADGRRTIEARLVRSAEDGAVVVRCSDVSERADRIDRLESAQSQLTSLLENVPMSIYFKDELGRHERVSDYITRTDPEDYIMNDEGKVHPHPEDIIGKTDFDLYTPSFAEETYADDMEVIEDEQRVINRIEHGTSSLGEPLYTATTKVPRYDDRGEVVGLVGVTMDVTERVTHREELERQNERLNEFAEVLTHDLRNPLNIAQGYLEVLEERYDPDSVAEAEAALDRMESLIEEIRAFVLEGRVVEEPTAVDLRETAEEAWTTVETGDATLEVEGDLRVKADRARFRRLLENLFRNAVEHATDDSAKLTVRVVANSNAFRVEDDGRGLPSDDEDIFERGFTTTEDGTGFGLAIVKSIAEAHGWSVSLCDSPAGGACFSFDDVVRAEVDLGRTIADD